MKIVLGINGGTRAGNQDAAAAVVVNGEIVACAEEERFIRIKHAPGVLPRYSIEFCLKEAKINIKDVDIVVFAGATYENMEQILKNFFNLKFRYCPKIVLIDHHLAHAASVYYTSGFNDSYIITSDLSGDNRSTVLFYADKNCIREIKSYYKPDSLGLFYATITQYLGFKYDNDECKTMALSAYKSKNNSIINTFLNIKNDEYKINRRFLDGRIMPGKSHQSKHEPLFNNYFIEKMKRFPRLENENIDDFYLSVAKTAQNKLEKAYFTLIKQLKAGKYKSDNLCLAGGVSLNVELNLKIAYSGEFKNMFVQPASNDAGLCLGGALHVAGKYGNLYPKRIKSVYLGPECSNEEVKEELDKMKIKYKYFQDDDLINIIAKKLAKGQIGAIFKGKMEYGPRALGNRSIVADPRDSKIKDILNKDFKERMNFQPFAPSVLEEYADKYFIFPKTKGNFEFMAINVKVKRNKKKEIVAAIHINDTARVQVVKQNINPFYYNVIKEFGKLTGTPVLLNTSLNKKGLPIARTPAQALNVFFTTPMDFISIENYLIEK